VLIERVVWPSEAEFPEIKALRGIRRLRFRRPVFPDQQLSVTVKHDQGRLTFEVSCAASVVASGQLLVDDMRLCAIIPTYDNPRTLEEVVARVREHIAESWSWTTGSASLRVAWPSSSPPRRLRGGVSGAQRCKAQRQDRACMGSRSPLRLCAADRCRSANMIRRTFRSSSPAITGVGSRPEGTLVLAQPIFDASAPRGRLLARKISVFWAMIETLGRKVGDPLCGYRVYPVATALRVATRGNAMDFRIRRSRCVWCGPASRRARPDSGWSIAGRSRRSLSLPQGHRYVLIAARISGCARRALLRLLIRR